MLESKTRQKLHCKDPDRRFNNNTSCNFYQKILLPEYWGAINH
jgi:hypothetical protein